MGKRAPLVAALLVPALLAACGGSAAPDPQGGAAVLHTVEAVAEPGSTPPGSIGALLAQDPREDVAVVLGNLEFAVGENRLRFLVLGDDGQPVPATGGRMRIAEGGLDAVPTIEATAKSVPVGVPTTEQGDEFDVGSLWIADVSFPAPGRYTFVVDPDGGPVQALGQIDVVERTTAPAVGARAIPSDNPTLDDDFAEKITTASPPDTELLRSSVADALAARVPFVVTFATPKYCASRVCGPVVDVVDTVRRSFEDTPVRFIHVEIYENNDPAQGFNDWVRAWDLPTEPWTFVVDRGGTIRARFEGLVTVGELQESVRDVVSS